MTSEAGDLALLRDEAALWPRLVTALDAAGEGAAHGAGADAWTARDVWAHLARWLAHAIAYAEAVRAGRTPVSITDFDVANARWRTEDAALTAAEARARALRARKQARALMQSPPPGGWDERLLGVFTANTAEHYREHLAYIREQGIEQRG